MSDIYAKSAQGIRYFELFGQLAEMHDIHYLTLTLPWDFASNAHANVCFPTKQAGFRFIYGLGKRLLLPDGLIIWLWQYKRKITALHKAHSFDSIIVCMTPFSLMALGKWLKNKYPEIRLIADMSDPYSFNMVISPTLLQRSVAITLERKYLPFLDYIVVLNESIVAEYTQLYPSLAKKLVCIEQGVDSEYIEEVEALPAPSNKTFTFLYAGAFYLKGRLPDNLFAAFDQCNLNVILHTYSTDKKRLRPAPSPRIAFKQRVLKNQLAAITAQADALILLDNEFGMQVPGKTLELLALSKPVLFIYSNDNSPTLPYVAVSTGVVTVRNDVLSIKTGIEKIVKGDYAARGFDYSPYTWDEMRKRYQNLIAEN